MRRDCDSYLFKTSSISLSTGCNAYVWGCAWACEPLAACLRLEGEEGSMAGAVEALGEAIAIGVGRAGAQGLRRCRGYSGVEL
jgi:hypothetical protein